MAAITAATIKYGNPLVTKTGGLLFTVTTIEVPETTEEYAEGGFELLPAKLGLTDGLVAGTSVSAGGETELGELTAGSGGGAAIWCNPMVLAKSANESGKQVAEAFLAVVTMVAGKPFLRIICQEKAEAGKFQIEPKTATKVKLKGYSTTVFAYGK